MAIESVAVMISVGTLMFYSGLLFNPSLFRQQFHHNTLRQLGSLAIANYVFIPLLTLCAIWFFSFPAELNLVLLTLSILPCAPIVPALVNMSGEPSEWSVLVFLIMSLINMVLLSILMAALPLLHIFTESLKLEGHLATVALAKYAVSVCGPMVLGAAIRVYTPRQFSLRLERFRRVVPITLFATLALLVLTYNKELIDLTFTEFYAFALFQTICIAVGFLTVQLSPNNKVTTVLACTLRNFAMGIAVTTIIFSHTVVPIYMVTFTILMLLELAIWAGIKKIRQPIIIS